MNDTTKMTTAPATAFRGVSLGAARHSNGDLVDKIEKAKNLLLNPNLRISEVAFAVGFQSLTHFNRVFKRILGQSPTDYRLQATGTG